MSFTAHAGPAKFSPWGADRLRLPCFHLGASVGILPAFSAFTGGMDMAGRPGERIFAIADEAVVGVQTSGVEAVATKIGRVEVDWGETSCETPSAIPYIAKMWAYKTGKAKAPMRVPAAKKKKAS